MVQGGNFLCSIQYVLEATLLQRTAPTEGRETKTKEVKVSKSISVENLEVPSHTPPVYDWPYTICRHVVRCPRRTPDGTQSAVRRLLEVFSRKGQMPDSDPELRLSVLLPNQLEIKEDSALAVLVLGAVYVTTAATDRPQSPTELCPDLYIHSFKISLNQHTAVRAGCHSRSSVKHIFTRKGSCRVPISRFYRSATETAPYPPATSINLCDVADLNVPTWLLETDFSTYNIARFHRLNASFSMVYTGKKHKLRLREVPIRISPRSGEQLQRRLSEGLEIDDAFGCDMAGIKWRCYGHRQSNFSEDGWQTSELVAGGPVEEDDFADDMLPPAYTV
ncbi:hypothetical protein LTR46_011503 [Exophiala xenobiotica]|nr:hypothetical protein LTR46_011503 [Exophiala xenobiotica]